MGVELQFWRANVEGSETLNKLVKRGGGGVSPCPSPVASTAAIHSLLQSRIDRKLSETWFYITLSTGAKRISNTSYHLSSPLPPRQLIVRIVMKEYEVNVQDIQLNY